jgi:ABC-2 type transport system permease protein
VLRYGFRLHRWGMIGYGVVLFVGVYVQAAAYPQLAGSTAASRAAFAHAMVLTESQLSFFLPLPYRVDTLAGYVQWRAYGWLSVALMIWAIAAAAGAVRGDEDRQLVDYWLSARVSRLRLVVSRLAAFALASLVVVVAGGLGALVGAASSTPLDVERLAGLSLALWVLAVAFFALCCLIAQLTESTRGAQAAGAAVLVGLYLLDVLARTQSSFEGLSWVSPFKWYDATNVLAPGGLLSAPGLLLCAAVIVLAGGLAALAFMRRDLRGPLFGRPVAEVRSRDRKPSPLLSWKLARLIYRQRWVLAGWTLGIALMAVFMVSIARGSIDSLINLPGMRAFLTHGQGGDPYRAFIASYWFGIAQLLLAGLAVHLVSTWSSDDTEGILASELSMPRHRWAVVLERGLLAFIGIVVAVAVGSLLAGVTAAAIGHSLDPAAVLRASWLLIPFALTFAAVGAAGSVLWPRAAVGLLGVVAFFSFLVWQLAPLMKWPSSVANLSVFQLYGSPLLSGVFWNGLWAMLAIVVAGFGLAAILMQRREVGP